MYITNLHVISVGGHEAFLEGSPALQRGLALLKLHVLPQQGCSPCLHMSLPLSVVGMRNSSMQPRNDRSHPQMTSSGAVMHANVARVSNMPEPPQHA